MKTTLLAVSLILFVAASFGAGTETPRKQTDLVKVLHYTRELGEFRDRIKVGIEELKKNNPDARPRLWDELARDVRTDEYTQWVMGLLDRMLTEKDVKELNVILSDLKKNGALSDLFGLIRGKSGKELTAAVDKFKRSYETRLVDELLAFQQSEAGGRYAAFREVKAADQGEVTARLLREAHQRVLARQK
ncbi:MAG TPA: hypothetical protein VHO24_17175 [Opitutaceae bacterium]|nr:hypothetical protein [Opitutaceae bacterium]